LACSRAQCGKATLESATHIIAALDDAPWLRPCRHPSREVRAHVIQYGQDALAVGASLCGMLRLMARQKKGAVDSLQPVDAFRWLVLRDRCSHVTEFHELRPNTNLRAALETQRDRLSRDGWSVDSIPRNCGFFFCDRDGQRLCVSIECFEPGTRSSTAWSSRRR